MREQPGVSLYDEVRAGFTRQRTSLNAWCRSARVPRHKATNALLGVSLDPSADKLRERLMRAAGLAIEDETRVARA